MTGMMGVMADPAAGCAEATSGLQDFGSWMSSEQRRVYALCQRFLQDRDEADSATQDVFLKAYLAWKKADAKEIEDPAKWVTRIAVNTCLDRLRSKKWQFWRKRPNPADEEVILAMAPSQRPDAEATLLATQIRERMASALMKLSLRQRAVFTLRHYEDRSLEEIAGILGLDEGTVKAHMFRALTKLRKELQDLYHRDGRA